MSTDPCPVNDGIRQLEAQIESGLLDSPRDALQFKSILELMQDIAWSRAEHSWPNTLVEKLAQIADGGASNAGRRLANALLAHVRANLETYASHVHSRNCPSGDCVKLAPAPCQMACPAGIDVPAYVTLIGQGRYADAISVIRRDNPFPWVCGLVCTRPCEPACVRGHFDSPVAIKALKAFAAEQALKNNAFDQPKPAAPRPDKVAVIGAGPAGLTAAYYLALDGYQVRVIESRSDAGGMIWLGIPRYRLPKAVIQREVDMITDLGVEIHYNTAFGSDTDFERLRAEGFKTFFFAIGAHQAMRLKIPGEDDFPDVLQSVEFLREVAMGRRQSPGRKVVVIGGGNVAIDAARTCVRLGCESVTIAYRRTRAEMPADEEEIIQALEEGVELLPLTVPVAVKGQDKNITALQCLKAKLVEREGSARKYPVPIADSDHDLETDCVISAIGQRIESDCLGELTKLKWTPWNTISVDEASMQTSVEGVFAAGDAVTGPATVVEAIGGGKRAARAIHRCLNGLSQSTQNPVPARRSEVEAIALGASEKQDRQRPEMPMVDVATRIKNFDEVELGFDEAAARGEAGRCLRCDICRRCGLCVEICRDQMGVEALELGYLFGGGKDHPTDLTKTNDKCIGCGACAVNCTNDAMQIHDKNGQRALHLCGTELSRQDLVACEACGVVVGTHRYLKFVQKRLGDVPPAHGGRLLCEACSRASAVAHLQVGIPS